MDIRTFPSLNKEEKIDFLLHCQKLLIDFHPDSSFIFRKDNVQERLAHANFLASQYQGFCYQNDYLNILFNKIVVTDINEPVSALKNYMLRPPDPNYNAVSIDFVVFRALGDCAEWVKSQYDPRIQYILYVKNGTPQIYKTEKLLAKMFRMPISVPQTQ